MMSKGIDAILVIHVSGRAGDTLFITPLLETIAKKYPKSKITLLAHRNTVNLLENCKYTDCIGTISKKRARYRGWNFIKKYNLAFVSSSPDEDADTLVSYACRVSKEVVAFKPNANKLIKCLTKSVTKNFGESRHIIDYYHDLTSSMGIDPMSKRIQYVSNNFELIASKKILKGSGIAGCDFIVAVKITSLPSRSYRDWPDDHLVSLMKLLVDKYDNIGFVAFGGFSEYERYENIANKAKAKLLNLSDKSLREVGSMMQYVDVYIGVDTGVTHLMSSFNTPMIVLYHPLASKRQYAPLNHPYFFSFECDGNDSVETEELMSTISPNLVSDKVENILDNKL